MYPEIEETTLIVPLSRVLEEKTGSRRGPRTIVQE